MFFAFFTGMLLWTGRLKKRYLNSMCALPLDGDVGQAAGLAARACSGCPGLPANELSHPATSREIPAHNSPSQNHDPSDPDKHNEN
jgi:hypothetical protein